MKTRVLVTVSALLAMSCSQASPPSAVHSPTPGAVSSPSPVALAASYGLLLVNGTLEMITPEGLVGPTASVAAPTVKTCVAGLNAWVEPPVSATNDKVFYRDGDTKIRFLTPAGQTGDATTVPGSATTVSFFSVSPDDQRIAVLVEDFSPSTFIRLGLYVEDLNGGGNHVGIYSTTTLKGPSATTLWPMGWHQGALLLAQMKACSNDPTNLTPSEWHVANASTGTRLATIKSVTNNQCPSGSTYCAPGSSYATTCSLSLWPSASGVPCVSQEQVPSATVFDWTGKLVATLKLQSSMLNGNPVTHSGLSASGQRMFLSTPGLCDGSGDYPPPTPGTDLDCPAFWTEISTSFRQGGSDYAQVFAKTGACLWIDETHLLAPDAVIELSQTASQTPTASRNRLPAFGECAGRYPGGL
jgi:hypothetical protein